MSKEQVFDPIAELANASTLDRVKAALMYVRAIDAVIKEQEADNTTAATILPYIKNLISILSVVERAEFEEMVSEKSFYTDRNITLH